MSILPNRYNAMKRPNTLREEPDLIEVSIIYDSRGNPIKRSKRITHGRPNHQRRADRQGTSR